MKNTNLFYLILFCFTLFSSCGSDDDAPVDNPDLQAELKGVWLYEGLTLDGTFESYTEFEIYYNFKSGGLLDITYADGTESGTYQVNGDNLSISIGGENETYSVLDLTDTKLDLFTEADVDEEPGLDEVTFHFSRD